MTSPAYVVVQFTVHDAVEFEPYRVASIETIRQFGGVLRARGAPEILHGAPPHAITALIEFASAEEARRWYQSEAYQALIPRRDKAAHLIFTLHEALPEKIS